jgi:peroxiredoxin
MRNSVVNKSSRRSLLSVAMIAFLFLNTTVRAEPPKVGDKAADFELKSLDGKAVALSSLLKDGPVVLVVLRGWPGYQCPICTRQVGALMAKSKAFADANAQVVLVYPGPSDNLQAHADEFISGKNLPENFHFVIDPDYTFTNKYDLRWDAPKETAYPSTFVIGKGGAIRYAKISHSHGDRAETGEVVKALGE